MFDARPLQGRFKKKTKKTKQNNNNNKDNNDKNKNNNERKKNLSRVKIKQVGLGSNSIERCAFLQYWQF